MFLISGNEPNQCPQPTEGPSISAAASGNSSEREAADAASNMTEKNVSEDIVSLRENHAVYHRPNQRRNDAAVRPVAKLLKMMIWKRQQKCLAV